MEENQNEPEKAIKIPCNACGGEMLYDAKSQKMLCQHCGSTQEVPSESDMIVEKPFTEALTLDSAPKGFDTEKKVFHCNNCGANTAVDTGTVTFKCGFCGSEKYNEKSVEQNIIKPAGVLPFAITKNQALDKFTEWLGKGFFYPSDLKKLASLDNIHGMYLPFWTYDAQTSSSWYADRGFHYYVTEYYTDSNGNQQSRQVQKTRWVSVSGYFQHFFDDVLVIGSKGVKQSRVEKIYPFSLEKVVNYDPSFLLGWEAEIYEIDVKEGFNMADGIMDKYIRSECAGLARGNGDTYRALSITTSKNNITYKHIMLPIWVAGYTYKNKIYQFIINGETGKVSGKKPLSWIKITITVLIVLIIIAVLVVLFKDK